MVTPTYKHFKEAERACGGGFWYHIDVSRNGFRCAQCTAIAHALATKEEEVVTWAAKECRERAVAQMVVGQEYAARVADACNTAILRRGK